MLLKEQNIKRNQRKKTSANPKHADKKLYMGEAIIESIMKSRDNIGRKYDAFAFFWQM